MKKLVIAGVLCTLCFASRAANLVHVGIEIGGLVYNLFDDGTAALRGYNAENPPKELVGTVEYEDVTYSVTNVKGTAFDSCSSLTSVSLPNATRIENAAFKSCSSLTSVSLPIATTIEANVFKSCSSLVSVSLPNATTIGNNVFDSCSKLTVAVLPKVTSIDKAAFYGTSLSVLYVSAEMKPEIDTSAQRSALGIPSDAQIKAILPEDVVKAAGYDAQIAISAVILKSGGDVLDENAYSTSCEVYGIVPQKKPTAVDFKAVSKDAQVVHEGEVAVKQTELQAAKAETVSIEGGVVSLAVGVSSNGNFTAETKDWKPVELKQENVAVKDGKIVISIPVSDSSGFMILQSGDAKVSPAN